MEKVNKGISLQPYPLFVTNWNLCGSANCINTHFWNAGIKSD